MANENPDSRPSTSPQNKAPSPTLGRNPSASTVRYDMEKPRRSVTIVGRSPVEPKPTGGLSRNPSTYKPGLAKVQASRSLKASKRPASPEPNISGNDRPINSLERRQTVQIASPRNSYKPLVFRRPTNEGFDIQPFRNRSSAGNISPLRESFTRDNIPSRSSTKSRGSRNLLRRNTVLEAETQGADGFDHPRRQKSLIRPERRPTQRRYPRHQDEAEGLQKGNSILRHDPIGRSDSILRVLKNTGAKPAQVSTSEKRRCPSCWNIFSKAVTWYAPRPVLSCCGMRTPEVRQAWREKMALCTLILFLCLFVGFLTFGLQQVLCGWGVSQRVKQGTVGADFSIVNGRAYKIAGFNHPPVNEILTQGGSVAPLAGAMDISYLFQQINGHCKNVLKITSGADPAGNVFNYFPCVVRNATYYPSANENTNQTSCHVSRLPRDALLRLPILGDVYYDWTDVLRRNRNLVVYNGNILDFDILNSLVPGIEIPPVFNLLRSANSTHRGTDVTFLLNNYHKAEARCAMDILKVGALDTNSMGCIISNIILYVSLIVILGVVLTKFFLAVFFGWVLSWRLGTFRQETYEERMKRLEAIELWSDSPNNLAFSTARSNSQSVRNSAMFLPNTSRYSVPNQEFSSKRNTMMLSSTTSLNIRPTSPPVSAPSSPIAVGPRGIGTPPESPDMNLSRRTSNSSLTVVSPIHIPPTPPPATFQPFNFPLAHTIMLVTCYSEGEQGLRTTLDSLTLTDYPASHKLILVIADGIITGYGNEMSTPDICLSMMKDFVIAPELVQPMSYIAIADGTKRHNRSKIYAGYYKFDETTVPADKQPRVPMILISKCGNQEEANLPKPGNRGKRDSQIILMSFLQHVMFDERMTEMEYELFNAIWGVTGVSPDNFEIVLMVDADTKVYPDSVTRMVSCMVRDPQIMGLCGETKIANKRDSWVTMIQVFEYYISHHLSKAFESVFGGVTCLPGCFCMYRIKAPKGPTGLWVPVLASPDIVEHYSENVVDTLHKKNLLLLGEDRFLTTLMLRTFPKRKMIFVPQAVCKTVVPDTFSILLSQRRRWINSTVHNLLELVLIRDLCGTFCFSMQFVVFLELLGTVVLPAAICFTLYLIIVSFLTTPAPIIPLILLAVILGLPAILILMTTRKVVYVGWMLIYLLSLFVWNFILPVYAFWHFDDFSWGQTRQVEGEVQGEGGHGEKEGEFDSTRITMKKWSEFERNKRRKTNLALNKVSGIDLSSTSIDRLGYHTPSQLARLSSVNLGANPRASANDTGYETSSSSEPPLK